MRCGYSCVHAMKISLGSLGEATVLKIAGCKPKRGMDEYLMLRTSVIHIRVSGYISSGLFTRMI